jgi:hypothetical protein
MPESAPSAVPERWQLTLQRHADRPGWQATLRDKRAPRRFESLSELMAWLGTLERPPAPPSSPPQGIR